MLGCSCVTRVSTGLWGRLQLVAHQLTPAHGVDVRGLVVDPLVELVVPAVEVDEQQAAHAALHRGHAHQPRLHQVHRLQLHVGGEAVAGVVLKKKSVDQLRGSSGASRARLPLLQC